MFNVLEKIAFTTQNGLVFCRQPQHAEIVEILLLEEARKLGASAVLFRRYYRDDKEKSPYKSEPAVYIFEKENIESDTALHAKIWSAGKAEVYMVLDKTNITIFNARRPAEVKEGDLSLKELELISKTIQEFNDQRFAAHLFGTGTFWEQGDFYDKTKDKQFFDNKLAEENTPYHQLFRFLKEVRKKLVKEKTIKQEDVIDKLLIICILIKFLEEIKDEKGHTLSQIYNRFEVNNFAEALFKNNENGKVIDILEELGRQLNGKIFDYFTEQQENETEQDFIKRNDEIKQQLRKQDLSAIAHFLLVRLNKETGELEFDLDSKQLKIDFEEFKWSQYSFRHLPIELISSIYEHFLQEEAKQLNDGKAEKGVVYTPPFLVNFLIDEVMPLDRYNSLNDDKFKILDPSCGSGIFLVAAYKRILQWWIIQYYQEHKQLPDTFDPKIFQELLEKNIFGVDINEKATLISIFSLTIAFLDKLSPIAFWENLKFANLRKNIPSKNFFEWAVMADKDFDLVIGNPPFNVPTEYKEKVKEYHSKFITPFQQQLGLKYLSKVPDNLAFYFLEFARDLSPKKHVCLIIPSTLLLYSPQETSINYRKALLENTNVEKIFDFTHLRRILFKKNEKQKQNTGKKKAKEKTNDAEPTVCVILLANTQPEQNNLEHIIIKRLSSTEKKLRFEIDHYDRHIVRYDWACTYPFVWKSNLLGGGRLFHLVYRLSLMDNLETFIENKKAENEEWIFQKGYIVGTPPKNQETIEYLYQKDLVSHISGDGEIFVFKDKTVNTKNFERPRPEELYKSPLLLFHLKTGEGEMPIGIQKKYTKTHLAFTNRFVGIHSPQSDFEMLQKMYDRFKHYKDTYMLWVLTNSSTALISQETVINKTDLDTLPFPSFEDEEYIVLSKTEEILRDDVLNHYKHLGKTMTLGNDGYDALERKLDRNKKEDSDILTAFGKTFCNNLNEIYAKNNKSWQIGQIHPIGDFILYEIGFGKNEEILQHLPDTETLEKLVYDKRSNRGAIYTRNIRFYKHVNGYDTVFLLKPSNIRYWLRSVALRDAGDTFMDLKKGGK